MTSAPPFEEVDVPSRTGRPYVVAAVAVVCVLALGTLGVMTLASYFTGSGRPYGADDVDPRVVGLSVTSGAEQVHAAGLLKINGRAVRAGNRYLVMVVDRRDHQAATGFTSLSPSVDGKVVTVASEPSLRGALAKYASLRVVNSDQVAAVEVPASSSGVDVPFVAALPANARGASRVSAADLAVVVAFVGPDDEEWWADEATVTGVSGGG